MSNIKKVDEGISEEGLHEVGLSVENIVATLDLDQEFDLLNLNKYLEASEYEPETTPFLIYRPSSFEGTILIPTNGMASLVGCKSKGGLVQLGSHLVSQLSEIAPKELPSPSELEIQNIVIQGEIGAELELTEITILFGMENSEYEPEQFPGVIYRPSDGRTILLFSSGKFLVNGAKTYSQAFDTAKSLIKYLDDAGVPIDTKLI